MGDARNSKGAPGSPLSWAWRAGSTVPEVVASLLILSLAVAGLNATMARLARVAGDSEARSSALGMVEERIADIRLYPGYRELDSVFSESGAEVPGFPEYRRTTHVTRVLQPVGQTGRRVDFTRITVEVDGPGLDEPISRTIAVAPS